MPHRELTTRTCHGVDRQRCVLDPRDQVCSRQVDVVLNTVRGSTLQGSRLHGPRQELVWSDPLLDKPRRQVLGQGRSAQWQQELTRVVEVGQDVDSDDTDDAAPTISGPAATLFEGPPVESPSKRRPPAPGWSSTTPTLKKMQSVARNLDEDLRNVLYQAASSSEAATRLSADEGDEDEVEDESNASRLEGPNKTGSSLTASTGSGLRHIHSCPEDSLEFTFWKHCRRSLFHLLVFCGGTSSIRILQARETRISWWKRRLPLLSVFTGLKKGRTLRS